MTRTLTITRAAPALGEIWSLKSWREAGKSGPPIGNFTAVTLYPEPKLGTGGQSNWVELELTEINWIKSLNVNSYKAWRWADGPLGELGTIYLGQNWETDEIVRWPRIALASYDNQPQETRNRVRVLEYANGFARIASVPREASYGAYESFPYFIHTSYTVYPDGHTGTQALYRMPLFDPASGFKISAGAAGLWLPVEWLHSRI